MNRTLWIRAASAFVALGVMVAAAACLGDNKGSYIDGTGGDSPPGGLGVDPGAITCGSVIDGCITAYTDEPEVCCAGPGANGGGVCLDGDASTVTCPSRTTQMLCNEEADCNVGDYCCGTMSPNDSDAGPDAGGGPVAAVCCPTPNAPNAGVQLCRTNGECQNGQKCVVQTCSDGLTYEFCGLYAPAGSSFTCKAK